VSRPGERPPIRRPAGAYIHGTDGPIMAAPARLAAWLEKNTNLNVQRVALRGLNPEIDDELVALHWLATWAVTASGTADGSEAGTATRLLPEPAGELVAEHINVNTAAELIGMSTRAVRKAIAEQRLPASRNGGQWLIDRTDAQHYRRNRAA